MSVIGIVACLACARACMRVSACWCMLLVHVVGVTCLSLRIHVYVSGSFRRFPSPASVLFSQAPAMDERTAKRVGSVQHIQNKPYYRKVIGEPDPFETCPTRTWRHKMRVWVLALKRMQDQDQLPQREDAAAAVMAGSQ